MVDLGARVRRIQRMRLALVLVLMVGGCANVHVGRATLISSTVLLACDWAQTSGAREAGWIESNPIMGTRPSAGEVDLYFASAALLNAAMWYLTPEKYRVVPGLAVSAIQTKSIAMNASYGAGVCGVGGPQDHPSARVTSHR